MRTFIYRVRTEFVLSSLVAGMQLGCGQAPPPQQPPPDVGIATNSDELFSLDVLPKFYLYLDEDGIEALNSDDDAVLKTYVRGRFEYDGLVWDNVAIRLKGNLTLTKLEEKPSFKIKFNKFEKGRRFLGLESLTLNNMRQDGSKLHEHLSYKVFREIGVPASRSGYAEVFVNGQPYGLYLNLESMDDSFLAYHFADPTGNLYEGEHGDDLDGDIEDFEQDEGDDTSRDDLQSLTKFALRENDDLFYAKDTPINVDQALDFVATETYVGHFDGYWTSHNYFLYHEFSSDKWTWMPWSLDQTFLRKTDPFETEGFLGKKCRESDRCVVDYVERADRIVDIVESLDLVEEANLAIDHINFAARSDERKRQSNSSMEVAQSNITDWVMSRPEQFRKTIDCIEMGVEPDRDGDGFGPCFNDCDDDNSKISPAEEEVCDEVDNNCSGFADDVPECACESHEIEGATFYFCTHNFEWKAASRFCDKQGHKLAWFDSREQNDEVWAAARKIVSGRWAIGLTDSEEEGTYVWSNGDETTFDAWAEGEPANTLDWFDCVFFRGGDEGEWRERNCSTEAPFVCREVESSDIDESESDIDPAD